MLRRSLALAALALLGLTGVASAASTATPASGPHFYGAHMTMTGGHARAAATIAPAAIGNAVIFWAAATGTDPCPDGVHIAMYAATDYLAGIGPGNEIDGWATAGTGTCDIHLRVDDVPYRTIPQQCAVIAHELGHARYGLAHEPGTVMAAITDDRPIPSACYAGVASTGSVHKGTAVAGFTHGAKPTKSHIRRVMMVCRLAG